MNTTLLFILLSSSMLQLPVDVAPTPEHDFHISKCLMHYRPAQQSLQISMHIFLDDLELALEQHGHESLQLCTAEEAAEAEAYLEAYLREEFQVTINGQVQDFRFVGKEMSDDLAAVWCYMEVTDVAALKSLEVRYSVLMDTYDDQKNLASLEMPDGEVGTMLFQKGNAVKKASF